MSQSPPTLIAASPPNGSIRVTAERRRLGGSSVVDSCSSLSNRGTTCAG